MKKTKSRISISLKGLTYQRVKDYCEARNLSVSGWVEEMVYKKLGISTETLEAQSSNNEDSPQTGA